MGTAFPAPPSPVPVPRRCRGDFTARKSAGECTGRPRLVRRPPGRPQNAGTHIRAPYTTPPRPTGVPWFSQIAVASRRPPSLAPGCPTGLTGPPRPGPTWPTFPPQKTSRWGRGFLLLTDKHGEAGSVADWRGLVNPFFPLADANKKKVCYVCMLQAGPWVPLMLTGAPPECVCVTVVCSFLLRRSLASLRAVDGKSFLFGGGGEWRWAGIAPSPISDSFYRPGWLVVVRKRMRGEAPALCCCSSSASSSSPFGHPRPVPEGPRRTARPARRAGERASSVHSWPYHTCCWGWW